MAVQSNVQLLFLLPLSTGLVCSFLLEQLLSPKPLPIWRRLPTLLLHVGTWVFLFTIELALIRRPWFAVGILLAFQLLLLLVNHAKYYSLREPFFFQDFEYFTDAIKHPRLYLPFFGIGRTLAATVGFVGALVAGILLEPPLTEALALPVLIVICAVLLIGSLVLIRQGLQHCPAISCDPSEDLRALGQITYFWAYWQAERNTAINLDESPFNNPPLLPPNAANRDKQPNIVVIQSESFFDPRPLTGNIKPSVLANFDQIKTEALYHGRLDVPAWGANTVRTECAFLCGLTEEQLGIHRFNPYRQLAKQGIPNLVSHLQRLGYETICIHPYPASFYLRNQVFPRMGFDRFIDIESFNSQQKSGQYIADLAVADKINELLSQQASSQAESKGKPVFIFAITMENHGPLHLERPEFADNETFYRQTPPTGSEDLTVYLRHLQNADLMIKNLKESLQRYSQTEQRAGMLCWYGDHVPIMPVVYQMLGEPDGHTDYFIWKTESPIHELSGQGQQVSASELGALILKAG